MDRDPRRTLGEKMLDTPVSQVELPNGFVEEIDDEIEVTALQHIADREGKCVYVPMLIRRPPIGG